MSVWTHPICLRCWEAREPTRPPVRIIAEDRVREKCCFCGEPNKDGIYVRYDPWDLPKHTEHAEEREGVPA